MKTKGFILSLLSLAVGSSLFISSTANAQTIPLYEQPDVNAKVLGTADLSTGIIPIFTPSNKGDWIKIADPRNGNVGWVKSSELSKAQGSSSVTFTQKIISNGSDQQPNHYQVIQFGTQPASLKPYLNKESYNDQMNAIVKKMQTEQQSLENSFKSIVKDMNDFFQYQIKMWDENKNTNSVNKTPQHNVKTTTPNTNKP